MKINSIGKIEEINNKKTIAIHDAYRDGLTHLDTYSHIHIIWWAHLADKENFRKTLTINGLFNQSKEIQGVFATRIPTRPNPIMVSISKIVKIDHKQGFIFINTIDAENDSPVLDIKPYHKMERVEQIKTPNAFQHWPSSYEDALLFDWNKEINKSRRAMG